MIEEILMSASQNVIEWQGLKINIWWWPFVYALIKNFLILLTLILSIATFLVFYRFQSLRTRFYDAIGEAIESGKLSKEKAIKQWSEIKRMSESSSLEENKESVLKAMAILNDVFKSANYAGDTLEKRIAKIPINQLNFKEDIIWVGKIESGIKDNSQDIGKEEISRAIYIVERALRELNIL